LLAIAREIHIITGMDLKQFTYLVKNSNSSDGHSDIINAGRNDLVIIYGLLSEESKSEIFRVSVTIVEHVTATRKGFGILSAWELVMKLILFEFKSSTPGYTRRSVLETASVLAKVMQE
jgi:hypothetical protein